MGSSREVAQANLYHLLARVFASPLEMDGSYPGQLRALVPGLDPTLGDVGRGLADAWENALKDPEALSLSYAQLFLGPFSILAPPYASFYLEPNQQLMGEVSQAVALDYAKAGLGPGHGPHEAPDHASLEWEFMYYLSYQYITTGEESWNERRKSFRTHLNQWMPVFTEAIKTSGEQGLYYAVSEFLTAMARLEPGD